MSKKVERSNIDRFFKYSDFKKGLDLYKYYNTDAKRQGLECEACRIMHDKKEYPVYQNYFRNDFLQWLRSRACRSRFIKDFDGCFDDECFKRILYLDESYSEKMLDYLVESISGVGPVTASAIITVIKPDSYGIVNKYVIYALEHYCYLDTGASNSDITVQRVLEVEKIMRNLVVELSDYIQSNKLRVREVDMALWGLGKNLKENR